MPFFVIHLIFSNSLPTGDDFVLVKVALRDYKDALLRSSEGDAFRFSSFTIKQAWHEYWKTISGFGDGAIKLAANSAVAFMGFGQFKWKISY